MKNELNDITYFGTIAAVLVIFSLIEFVRPFAPRLAISAALLVSGLVCLYSAKRIQKKVKKK